MEGESDLLALSERSVMTAEENSDNASVAVWRLDVKSIMVAVGLVPAVKNYVSKAQELSANQTI